VGAPRRRVLLVGAGHAHLHVLRRAETLRRAGAEPILISPPVFHSSGLATGVLSGALEPAAVAIDVAALAARHGVTHLAAEVAAIDCERRVAVTDQGERVAYDAASLNVGSVIADPLGLAQAAGTWSVKPLASLLALRREVELRIHEAGRCPRIVVAGGGPSALEVAAALAGLAARHQTTADVTLVAPSQGAAWGPPAAAAWLSTSLARRGVAFVAARVVNRSEGYCGLEDGRVLPCEALVLAGGLATPAIIGTLGLATADDGRLLVTPALQAVEDASVFAVGDCAQFRDTPRPRLGIFGVRAAPTLLANLSSPRPGGPRNYRPQRRWLSIMDLGQGHGLAIRGPLWAHGRWVLALKRGLDFSFVRRHRS
jgi:NADH dehydrogenase FAD-containing subunit